MMKRYEHLPIESLVPQFRRWVKVYQRKEVGNVFFLPNTGILYRAHQLVDWYGGEVELIDAKGSLLTEVGDLREVLDKKSNKQIVLVVHGMLFESGGVRLAEIIAELSLVRSEGMIVIHDGVPTSLSKKVQWPMVIHQNKWQYQLPDKEAVGEYLVQVLADWRVKMGKNDREQTVRYCGGHLWLVNELIRLRGENGEASLEELLVVRSLEEKKELIWESMSSSYQGYLMNREVEREVEGEMQEYGLISSKRVAYGEWLERYAKKAKESELKIGVGEIIYMGKEVTGEFSERERAVLARLYESEGVVRREELGEVFWGSDDYSDWSLDQMVSRLRGKIKRVKLPVKILTKKGKGYELGRR